MFPVQRKKLKINHLTPLLAVTMPYDCWFLLQVDYIEDFKWRSHFQLGVVFWRVVLKEVYFERIEDFRWRLHFQYGDSLKGCFERGIFWRALKTSMLNTAHMARWRRGKRVDLIRWPVQPVGNSELRFSTRILHSLCCAGRGVSILQLQPPSQKQQQLWRPPWPPPCSAPPW